MLNKTFRRFSLLSLCLMIGPPLWSVPAAAQGSNAAHTNNASSDTAKKKEVKFEVISIRPLKSGSAPIGTGFTPNPTPDGFVSTLTVWQMLMVAYAPNYEAWQSTPMINAPKWFGDADWYVINARVSDADREAWRNQSNHHELLRSAMQDLLKERCQLVIHEQPTEIPDYKLVIGKKGLKGLKASAPGSVLPKEGYPLPTGGVRFWTGPKDRTTWHYYGANIGELVDFLSLTSQARPVHDETGLTGRYDFTMQMIENPSHDREEEVFNWPVEPLGLELKPGKYHGFTLVIDHMDKPSPN
jgi:uncharacterized protein (TIGR03435 family)